MAIKKSTCLVLGAGASKPYGLPTGPELRDKLIAELSEPGEVYALLTAEGGHPEVPVREFLEALAGSEQPSVDVFLANREEFVTMGKLAMAAALIECERDDLMMAARKGEDHWYAHIWRYMTADGVRRFGGNKLSVVTFNYDRSLEWFLINAYRHTFGEDLEEAKRIVDRTVEEARGRRAGYLTATGAYGRCPERNHPLPPLGAPPPGVWQSRAWPRPRTVLRARGTPPLQLRA